MSKVVKKVKKAVKKIGRKFDKEILQEAKDGVSSAGRKVGREVSRFAHKAGEEYDRFEADFEKGWQQTSREFRSWFGMYNEKQKMPDMPDVDVEPGAQDAALVEEEAPAPEFGGKDSEGTKSRRKGRRSLRIDLRTGNAGSGGTGLNIPRG